MLDTLHTEDRPTTEDKPTTEGNVHTANEDFTHHFLRTPHTNIFKV